MRSFALLATILTSLHAAPAEIDALPGLELQVEELEFLPHSHHEWNLFSEQHKVVLGALWDIRWRHGQLQKKTAQEPWDLVSLRALEQRAREAQADLLAVLEPWGVDKKMLSRIAHTPPGSRLAESYARSLVLTLDSLEERQRALLAQVVHSIDAGDRVLHDGLRRLDESDEPTRRAMAKELRASMGGRGWEIDRRFWKLADYVLNPEQLREIRRQLPRKLQAIDDLRGHLVAVPGLTPAQANRVRAVIAEYDAESAADTALTRKLEQKKRDGGLAKELLGELQAELGAAYRRLSALQNAMQQGAHEILDATQVAYLQALPPRIYSGDRRQPPREVLGGFDLSSGQLEQLAGLEAWQARHEREMNVMSQQMQERMSAAGPDSPQAETMQMMNESRRSTGREEYRRLLREVFLEVLQPHQVAGWVLGLSRD